MTKGFTVQSLIDLLNDQEDKSLPVVLYCDDGQTPMALIDAAHDIVEDADAYTMNFATDEQLELDNDFGHDVFVLAAI